MSGEEIAGGAAGAGVRPRPPRAGGGGAPVGSTLSIVLALIAVVGGFLILNSLTGGDDSSTGSASLDVAGTTVPVTTIAPIGATETTSTTTTTTIAPTRSGALVVVANANTVGGSAGRMSKALEAAGFEMGSPTNATGEPLGTSVVYFDPTVIGAEPVARQLGLDLGGVDVLSIPTPIPTDSASLDGAGVLLMLGDAQVDTPLADLQAQAAGAAAAPDVATGDAATTDG